jgi:hypothetical protein
MAEYDYSKGRVCGCGARVCNKSKSGQCRACFMDRLNADPNRGAKTSATLKERLKDPAIKARHLAGCRKAALTKRGNHELRERLRKIMREQVQPVSVATGANVRGRDYKKMAEKGKAARWAWCPPEYRETYRDLTAKGVGAREARRMLAEQIRADLAKLSPFERQERALANGAQLVANDQKPSLASPGVYAEDAA